MVGGGIFSVLWLTVQVVGAGAYLSFVAGGAVAVGDGKLVRALVRPGQEPRRYCRLPRPSLRHRLAGSLNVLL